MYECVSTNLIFKLLLQVIGFHRQPRTDHTTLSHAKALKNTRCGSIEATTRYRRLFAAGAFARQKGGRLRSRVMFATMADGEDPKQGA